ncbi:unnamed protein product [Symbiodinium sp. CCMP2592]|nr:unnamed protein product [Symbiodinium sp. CCMP2592]
MCALPRPRPCRLTYGTRLVAGHSMEAGGGGAGRRGKTQPRLNSAFVAQKQTFCCRVRLCDGTMPDQTGPSSISRT